MARVIDRVRPAIARARPVIVAIASVILPGLGHFATGARRAAAVFLVPTLLAMVVAALWVVTKGAYGVVATLVTPTALTLLFAANILVAGWRTSAAIDAVGRTQPGRVAVAASAVVVLLAVAVPHVIVGNTLMAAESFLDETFAGLDATPGPDTADAGQTDEPVLHRSPGGDRPAVPRSRRRRGSPDPARSPRR